jgi:hypothetical protein
MVKVERRGRGEEGCQKKESEEGKGLNFWSDPVGNAGGMALPVPTTKRRIPAPVNRLLEK